ncbi:hypothetical protein KUV50_16505 [Membranicola marinus]|uniref:Uncharacterized protein n=1 Tax=Membranihabitans marinus TaxID=1227546 RepID=A0A953L8F3_9BACT|nr:hypothetical protein [Membranihabitans marinus]MBY5959757.1 hypothetical protein [Membranihabitans marinus]
MSNLIIDAINIGFEVFPYDRFGENREKYQANIPDRLVKFPGNKIIDFEVTGENFPYLVKAYRSALGEESVPIDIIEKEYDRDNTVLILPSGDYIVEIIDRDRTVTPL